MKDHRIAADEKKAYNQGSDARKEGRTRFACPYEMLSRLGAWFLCGWNEADQEMKTQIIVKKRRRVSMEDGYRL